VYAQGRNEVRALKGITLALTPAEFVCISGRSGSGKTTLLNCMGTLDSVSEGKIVLEGSSIEALPESALLSLRRNYFGFVFQQPRLFSRLSVLDNVALPLVYRGVSWKEARNRARRFVEDVGLIGRIDCQARLLSGGEAARAGIARAVVHQPKILLADEPTAELDNANSGNIVDLLVEQSKRGTTVIVAGHDPMVQEKAGRFLRLEDGKLVS